MDNVHHYSESVERVLLLLSFIIIYDIHHYIVSNVHLTVHSINNIKCYS